MKAPSLSPELVSALKRLRLGGLLPTLAERLELAYKHSTPYQDVLLMLLSARHSAAAAWLLGSAVHAAANLLPGAHAPLLLCTLVLVAAALVFARHAVAGAPGAYDGHLEVLLDQCDRYVDAIRRRSREAGVGVNLVFVPARIEQIAERLRLLRTLALPDPADDAATLRRRATAFFVQLVQQENRRHSLRDLFAGTTQLLARRVTEQASKSGEHYVSGTRGEFFGMFRAAAGAGSAIRSL